MGVLYSLEGGLLRARVAAARGHCGKIGNLYDQHLSPWFKRVTGLEEAERRALKDLFKDLKDTDNAMINLNVEATEWLVKTARTVLDLVDKGKLDEANAVVAKSRKEILPTRQSLMRALTTLRELEADFIGMSDVA